MSLKIIYEPKGRAREYADLALNIYNSCDFGCEYCYVPRVLKIDRQEFHTVMRARDQVLEKVEHDCRLNLFEGRKVLLCFTCDPYQSIDLELQLTREVLKLFKKYNINFSVLTKGGIQAVRDFDLYKPGDSFGTTLTFQEEFTSQSWEPGAALPENRIRTIQLAHIQGIHTWVSLEPVINPDDAIWFVQLLHPYVDFWKVGRWNYDARANKINWKAFGQAIEEQFKCFGSQYYIKEDLRKEMKKNA